MGFLLSIKCLYLIYSLEFHHNIYPTDPSTATSVSAKTPVIDDMTITILEYSEIEIFNPPPLKYWNDPGEKGVESADETFRSENILK